MTKTTIGGVMLLAAITVIAVGCPDTDDRTAAAIADNGDAKSIPPDGEICNLTVIKVNDLNGNGAWDPGEPEIDDWPVTITDPSGDVTETSTPVCINDPELGTWAVEEGFFEGWWETGVLVNGVSYPDLLYLPVEVEFTCDEQFSIVFLNATCEGGGQVPGSICALKVYDVDGDGPDEGDPPLPFWPICLLPCPDGEPRVMVDGDLENCACTDCEGRVCFTDLEPGCYMICEPGPCANDLWHPTSPTCVMVELTEGGSEEVVFSNYCVGTISMVTKGWWQSKNGCAALSDDPTLLETLNSLEPFMSGCIKTTGRDNCNAAPCQKVYLPFDSPGELGCFIVAPNNQSKVIGLAQQIAAFALNCLKGAGTLDVFFVGLDATGADIIEAAIDAWETGIDVPYWQCLLDQLNNACVLDVISPVPCEIGCCEGESDGCDDRDGCDDGGDDGCIPG